MSITYLEAIREAQARLLREDERVFIYGQDVGGTFGGAFKATKGLAKRSEEHTSELQSQSNLVCRLLLEKKKIPDDTPVYERENVSVNTPIYRRSLLAVPFSPTVMHAYSTCHRHLRRCRHRCNNHQCTSP